MQDLKKQLAYIDKTNWLFERDTVDFSSFIPFETEEGRVNRHAFTLGQHSSLKK